MPIQAPSPWLLSLPPPMTTRLKLFCFPHAGGGGSAFVRWPPRLPVDVHVCPVQLPGRENRYSEPLPRSGTQLVTAIATQVPFGDGPFAFFGHSMGSVVALEVARALRKGGRTLPRLIIASASTPPQFGYGHITLHQAQGPELIRQLRMYGTPEAVMAHQELLELAIPIVQNDSRLVNEYRHAPEPPLPVPLVVYSADSDPTVPTERLDAWRELTSARFARRTFRGGHMYLHPGDDAFFSALSEDLATAAAGG